MAAFNHQLMAKLREKLGLSRREVILKLHDLGVDIAENTVANWEEGATVPDADMLLPLGKVFGVKAEDWLNS